MFSSWQDEFLLIQSIWTNSFPNIENREPLSVIEKAFMSVLIFLRSLSLNRSKALFSEYRTQSEISEFYNVAWLLVMLFLLWHPLPSAVCIIIVLYRLMDLLNYRLCIIFVDKYRQNWGLRSINRSLILLIINYFEIIIGFAVLFSVTKSIGYVGATATYVSKPLDLLHYSISTITTLGISSMHPLSTVGRSLTISEPLLGFILVSIIISMILTGVKDIREKKISPIGVAISQKSCPFCDVRKKFTHTWFSDIGEQKCQAWIDYKIGHDNKFLWYAVLNGDQYTYGNTLFILGPHREKITDQSLTELELNSLITGLKKVTRRLKQTLGVKTVHVLSLCEGVKHLHFHLIPRYPYEEDEKKFFIENYWNRERKNLTAKGKKKWQSRKQFEKAVMGECLKIHGMWYAAYHEMKFKASSYWKQSVVDRVKELEHIASIVRDPTSEFPFK